MAIRINNLHKVYKVGHENVTALKDINLGIIKGEMCCIVGPSGSGKSTLLNMLAGLEKPTRGSVYIKNKKISKFNEDKLALFRQKYLGFIFQSYNLLPQLTAWENVALPLMFKGVPLARRKEIAINELKHMGLESRAEHKPSEMSGGQQQRVGVARAFVTRPDVIFADEPTGNLDTRTTYLVLRTMIERAKNYDTTFVMVTHERELAMCADRIITIQDGSVLSNVVQDQQAVINNRAQLFGQYSGATLEENMQIDVVV